MGVRVRQGERYITAERRAGRVEIYRDPLDFRWHEFLGYAGWDGVKLTNVPKQITEATIAELESQLRGG